MKLFQLFESRELNSEFLWFQRYISDHDLETQIEIENDKIIFHTGKRLIGWDAAEARRIRTKVVSDPRNAYWSAADKRGLELMEPAIAMNSLYSLWYARDVICGRFERGEPVLATNSKRFQLYQEFLETLK